MSTSTLRYMALICIMTFAVAAGARAGMEVRVVELVSGVEVRKLPGDWVECTAGMVLTEGHEISCDPDGQVTLAFANNSTVVVQPMTQIKISAFSEKGGVVATEILLRIGEMAAKVQKSDTIRSDFKVRSPTATASVRGTEIQAIRFDPVSGTTIAMASGTLDMTNNTGSSSKVSGTDSARTGSNGVVVDPQSNSRQSQASGAFAPGLSGDEVTAFQARGEPIVGESRSSAGSVGDLGNTASSGLMGSFGTPVFVSKTNSNPGFFDSSSGSRTFNFTSTDFASGLNTVSAVRVSVDFAKLDGESFDVNNGGSPLLNEIVLNLTNPAGTTVSLIGENSFNTGSVGFNGVVTFDQAAPSVVNADPNNLVAATVRPVGDLRAFNGGPAAGTWTLGIEDTVGLDGLSFHSAKLDVAVGTAPPALP